MAVITLSRSWILAVGPAAFGLSLVFALLTSPPALFLGLTGRDKPAFAPTVTATALAVAPPTATASPPAATASPTVLAAASPRATATAVRLPAPARLRIPRIGVDAPIVNVGLLDGGELEAPSEGDQVGWFSLGVRPGEVGNALLDGHRDWQRSIAVFWRLGELEPGDSVFIRGADGQERSFTVEWRLLFPVANAPMDRIVGATDVPAVTLITCGGQFDRTAGGYTSRWVVRAVAKPSSP